MLKQLPKHRPGRHPVIKKNYNFNNDKYAWYWIYLKSGVVFNTYDWYIISSGPIYTLWQNFYYAGEPHHKCLKIKTKWIKKIVCWKTK